MSGEIQIVNGSGVDLRCCAYELRSARDLSIASFDVEVSCSSADRSDRSHRALCFLRVALEPQSWHEDLMVDVTVLENISNIRIY